jgi:hypothetical protein
MKNEEIYDSWKKQRSQIEVGQNFTEKVMNHVYQYEQKRKASPFDIQWLVETVSAHPLAQVAMIAVGTLVGFVRLILMIHLLLYT